MGKVRTSDAFIVATNDDKGDNESSRITNGDIVNGSNAVNGRTTPGPPQVTGVQHEASDNHIEATEEKPEAAGPRGPLEVILEASRDRRWCVEDQWDALKETQPFASDDSRTAVAEEELKDWVREYPVRPLFYISRDEGGLLWLMIAD